MTGPLLALLVSLSTQGAPAPGLGGGGSLDRPVGAPTCVDPALRERIGRERLLLGSSARSGGFPPPYPFHPLGGNLHQDAFPGGFVDLDPSSGFRSYSCDAYTYDGHRGHDTGLRSFDEQLIGVPVFAVRDGTVLFAQDGFFDMRVAPGADSGNYVIVDHGDGQDAWYFHLANGSVAFTAGQAVKAGDQVGLAASSGYSFGPHLHFETQESLVAVEPYAGDCNPTASRWARQEPLVEDTFLFDFGVTKTDLATVPGLPFALPVDAQIELTDTLVRFWLQGANLPPGSVWRVRFVRPDGTTAYDSLDFPFFNTDWYRGYWFWWGYDIPDMHAITGTWRIQVEFNGASMVDAPVEVVATRDPLFNRAPAPIAVGFDPPAPDSDDVVSCRVAAPVLLEDLDWDIVRYRYVWKVDGATVRDVVSAARSDAIPRNTAAVGAALTCDVTPSDGKVDGVTVQASALVQANAWTSVGCAKHGGAGVPFLAGAGSLLPASSGGLTLAQAAPSSFGLTGLSKSAAYSPLFGGTLVPFPLLATIPIATDVSGGHSLPFTWPSSIPSGTTYFLQTWIVDPSAGAGLSASNGIVGTVP